MNEKRRYGNRELPRWMGEVDDFPFQKCNNCRVLRDSVKRNSFCVLYLGEKRWTT